MKTKKHRCQATAERGRETFGEKEISMTLMLVLVVKRCPIQQSHWRAAQSPRHCLLCPRPVPCSNPDFMHLVNRPAARYLVLPTIPSSRKARSRLYTIATAGSSWSPGSTHIMREIVAGIVEKVCGQNFVKTGIKKSAAGRRRPG